MKYIAAYKLYVLANEKKPTAEELKAILSANGATFEEEKINNLITSLESLSLEEAAEIGAEKMNLLKSSGDDDSSDDSDSDSSGDSDSDSSDDDSDSGVDLFQ